MVLLHLCDVKVVHYSTGILFRSQKGKALNDRNVANRVLNRVIRETGLPRFTFHDLRRTHATMLVAAGIDPKVVQLRMGHESIETTLKYYAQPTKERREAASQVAVRYLSDGAGVTDRSHQRV